MGPAPSKALGAQQMFQFFGNFAHFAHPLPLISAVKALHH